MNKIYKIDIIGVEDYYSDVNIIGYTERLNSFALSGLENIQPFDVFSNTETVKMERYDSKYGEIIFGLTESTKDVMIDIFGRDENLKREIKQLKEEIKQLENERYEAVRENINMRMRNSRINGDVW